jgi:Kef-type K+ transport system membrane component KefB
MTLLETLGTLLLCGFFAGNVANRCKFPRVTGYIVAGVLLSPSVSGLVSVEIIVRKFSVLTNLALAIIAYSIGGSLKVSKLRMLGGSILWINLSESLGAFLLTFGLVAGLGPLLLRLYIPRISFFDTCLPMALIVAAICAATAPAAVLAIVHEYRASGPLTNTLLGVVALDDGMAVILYTFASTVVTSMTRSEGFALFQALVEPGLLLVGAVLLGGAIGALLAFLAPRVKRRESLLVVILGGLALCTGLSTRLGFSHLLANMAVGFFVVNRARHSHSLFAAIDRIEEPVFVLFFTLAGAHFDVRVIRVAGLLALLISAGRFGGKLLGTRIGAWYSHAPPAVARYLGYGLLPTAGVTTGLILMVQPFGDAAVLDIMVNAVLGSVVINELLGPPLVKYALTGAGEGRRE